MLTLCLTLAATHLIVGVAAWAAGSRIGRECVIDEYRAVCDENRRLYDERERLSELVERYAENRLARRNEMIVTMADGSTYTHRLPRASSDDIDELFGPRPVVPGPWGGK